METRIYSAVLLRHLINPNRENITTTHDELPTTWISTDVQKSWKLKNTGKPRENARGLWQEKREKNAAEAWTSLSCPFSAAPAKLQLAAPTLLVITTSWSIPNPSWFHWKHLADLGDLVVGEREPVVNSSDRDITYLNPIHLGREEWEVAAWTASPAREALLAWSPMGADGGG
jgi:hypothetical protein